jgi:lysophospholipase L1-like esterase
MIIHVSTGGNTLRLQLSNVFGSSDTDIRSVYVADAGEAQQIDVKSAKYLTFNGKKNVTLKKGESLYSDEFAYNLKPLQLLSITINYGDRTPENATSHRGSRTTSYIISGESKPKSYYDPQEKVDHWYNIAALEVKTTQKAPVVACLGNSITDGRGTTTNKQNRWTDFLAEGLGGKVGVLNLGIGGNAVIKGGLSEPALKRFDRDILGQQGVTSLIIFEGVNDIGGAKNDSEQRANDLIAAYREMMAKAHNKGIKVYLGTITPFKGNGYYTIFHEAARQYVNDWIRNCKECDGIIDFDALVRDPNDPAKLKAEFSDDWLHLNPKGYEAMGKLAAEKLK